MFQRKWIDSEFFVDIFKIEEGSSFGEVDYFANLTCVILL